MAPERFGSEWAGVGRDRSKSRKGRAVKAYRKLREWLARYGPAELASVVSVVSLATTIFWVTRSRAWAACAGALIEAPMYYGVMWLRDERVGLRNRLKGFSTEFGPATIITVVLRPFLLYQCPLLVGSIAWGTAIAKVTTDLCFYSLVICMYETVGKQERARW